MTDLVTVTGFVGNDPRHSVTDAGLAITNFRLASTRRYFDRAKGEWADGETNWYSVAAFRQLAVNTAAAVSRGDRVVVHGRLRVRAWETGEKSGTAVEIDADAIGHDLSWARVEVVRPQRSSADAEPNQERSDRPADGVDAWARPGGDQGWPGDDAVVSGAVTTMDDEDTAPDPATDGAESAAA